MHLILYRESEPDTKKLVAKPNLGDLTFQQLKQEVESRFANPNGPEFHINRFIRLSDNRTWDSSSTAILGQVFEHKDVIAAQEAAPRTVKVWFESGDSIAVKLADGMTFKQLAQVAEEAYYESHQRAIFIGGFRVEIDGMHVDHHDDDVIDALDESTMIYALPDENSAYVAVHLGDTCIELSFRDARGILVSDVMRQVEKSLGQQNEPGPVRIVRITTLYTDQNIAIHHSDPLQALTTDYNAVFFADFST
eukprot:TRINITY_DN7683_c0_g1::TRINITY_DN7683_c0_g1_i1::g.18511::m.18511 TRINITY_DN7683_c0_g1::TRINITY_DN7683_c0_g1_i1::g.18511  ORF type:complete len:250 (-),score=45.75 TRINITY_DN7683_c0_g1_i1:48-797(-)